MNKNDRKVIAGIKKGDHKVLLQFYKDHFHYIRGYIIQNSGTKQDVEDVFQDALLLLYQKIDKDALQLTVALKTYFYAICKNLWKQRLEKKGKMPSQDIEVVDRYFDEKDDFLEDWHQKEEQRLYAKHLARLSNACKELLELVFVGKSMRDIAIAMNYTEGSARKKKFECKKSLMKRIEQDPLYQEITGGDLQRDHNQPKKEETL